MIVTIPELFKSHTVCGERITKNNWGFLLRLFVKCGWACNLGPEFIPPEFKLIKPAHLWWISDECPMKIENVGLRITEKTYFW